MREQLIRSRTAKAVLIGAAAATLLAACGRSDAYSERLYSCSYKATTQKETDATDVAIGLQLNIGDVYDSGDFGGADDYSRTTQFLTSRVMELNGLTSPYDSIPAGKTLELPKKCDPTDSAN